MFPVDLYVKVRRAVMVENRSEREVARYFGVPRNAIMCKQRDQLSWSTGFTK